MDRIQVFGRVAGHVRSWIRHTLLRPKTMYGKVTLLTTLASALLGILLVVGIFLDTNVAVVSADNVSTSVTVLNTPPTWTVSPTATPSSTSTPLNAGEILRWTATAVDSGNDNYYLLICKTSGLPTANANAAPTCNGGSTNQWAVSAATVTGVQASVATTTIATYPFNAESNIWYGWVCDGNASLPLCYSTYDMGTGNTGSPFFIDHPPVFTSLSSSVSADPGGSITWTATATTTDIARGGDTLRLFVCKSNDFTAASTTAACGAGGTWATSTLTKINPSATYTIPIPTQDKNYTAYVYLTNNFNLAATSTLEGSSSPYTVNNVAPTVSAATISVVDPVHSSSTLILVNPAATSGPYWIKNVQVTDNNSCLNASSGNEIASMTADVFRSAIASTSCHTAGNYDPNNCYPQASSQVKMICTQDAGSCTGAGDSTATYTCVFDLWYNADPTDTGSQYPSQNWLADVQATDDNGLTSVRTDGTTGTVLSSFLAFAVSQTSIAFGGLQPGQQNDPLLTSASTTIRAIGNVGVDETLYGDSMCTNWAGPDSCDHLNGLDATKDIPVINQKAGTSTVAYGSAFAYALYGSTSPQLVGIHVQKTTATSSPQNKNTYWGIKVPVAITYSGSYSGQDTITALTSSSTNW